MLGREVVSCGGDGISWPFILEGVKLEVGNMSRKEVAHIAGTKHISLNYLVCDS